MAFHPAGFRTYGIMGTPSTTGAAGSVLQKHSYVTNDDKAAVETAAYFNALLTPAKKVNKGDLIEISMAVGTTPANRTYSINIVANAVVLIPSAVA